MKITNVKEKNKEIKLTDKEYRMVMNKILTDISESLIKGEKVKLRGFGTWVIKMHQAKKGRNPRTGETIQIPSKKAIKFVPSKQLKLRIQNSATQ